MDRTLSITARLVLLLALLLLPTTLFAAGSTEESDFEQVEGTGNWEHEIDASELEPGMYNILVRARDEAGNESIGGPYNIYIDPASDLPTASILYPQLDQRAGDELFVVGSARDNESVSAVEVRIDDGTFRRAEGGEFWSARLSLANLADGPHTVTARAIDNNGLTGPEQSVRFRIDTAPPAVTLDSHESGMFVTQRTTVAGRVSDANGVAALELETEAGSEVLALRGRDGELSFTFRIDPAGLDEGPHVWWLKASDRTGQTGSTPFLFFVDTQPPVIEILSPAADERSDAQLRFVGRASDTVGVASLAYELSAGQTGEIPLVPGNPYWTLAVDLPPASRGTVTATFIVTDVAGNERRERVRITLDDAGDRPVVIVSEPAEGAVTGLPAISGHIVDDDGGAEVVYTLNGGPEQRSAAASGFYLPLDDLAPGQHDLRVYAIDRFGVVGPEVRRRFRVSTPLPSLALERVVREASDEPYAPGFELQARERVSVAGRLTSPSNVANLAGARVAYTVGATSGQATVAADGSFTIPLPRTAIAAAVSFRASYQNELGESVRLPGYFVQLPETTEASATPAQIVPPGIYLSGPGDAGGAGTGGDPTDIYLPVGSSIQMRAAGGAPSAVQISGGAGATGTDGSVPTATADQFLSIRASGDIITITATAHGAAEAIRVSATVAGRTLQSAPFSVRTSNASPRIDGVAQLIGTTHATPPEVIVDASDPLGISAVELRVIGVEDAAAATPAGASPPAAGGDTGWSRADAGENGYVGTPALTQDDGPALLQIRSTNRSGRTSTASIPIVIDRAAPEIRVVAPGADDVVNGTITVAALVDRPDSVRSIRVAGVEDSAAEKTLPVDRLITHDVMVTDAANEVRFVLTNHAGVERTITVAVATDEEADRPRLLLQVPEEGAAVTGALRLSGVLLDDDAPAAIGYSLNDGNERRVETDGLFDVSIPMDSFDDGEYVVQVVGYDLAGTPSVPVRRSLILSRSAPTVALSFPRIDEFHRGVIELRGTSEDPNGIASVLVSTNSGASFDRATGTDEWTHQLDTTLLTDGTHSLLVSAVDGAGKEGLLATIVNVDNTAPLLELAAPADGAQISGTLVIDGRADDLNLDAVRILAQPLDQSTIEVELSTFTRPGPFGLAVESEGFEPGWYNIRIEAADRAGNVSHVSRNVEVVQGGIVSHPRIILPAPGQSLAHEFDVIVEAPPADGPVTLLANGRPLGLIGIDGRARGRLRVESGRLSDGPVTLTVRGESSQVETESVIESREIDYQTRGAWLTVDGPEFLDYVRNRPFVTGTAGYEIDLPAGDDRDTERERERIVAAHSVTRIEVSSNNGESWTRARGTSEWEYRIETTELPDGRLNLIVRAHFANGSVVTRRHSVIIDEQPPTVRLLEPSERDRFSTSIRVVGVTADENGLGDVAVALRSGDKSRYEVPSFIQGLYVDAHALGATYFDIGAGLTFFDNNVRLQAQIGVAPPGRFSGLVIGTKLLANVASFPASFFFGPDLEWLSAALAVGANFSYFTMSQDQIAFTADGLVLAGMLAQLEFPIVTIANRPILNTYAFYTEAQLWFISSDVEAGTAFRMGFGVRADIF